MQALILAAGMGKRLDKYTANNTKCMVEVNGVKLIDRILNSLKIANIKKVIIVVGYKAQNLIDYINKKYQSKNPFFEFVFVNNEDYEKTNNIYSFYLSKEYSIQDDTILLESDIIYDENLIKQLVDLNYKNVSVIAKYQSWMDGTVVVCDENNYITNFIPKKEMDYSKLNIYSKTVNVYKFSKEFLKNIYFNFVETYMKVYGLNNYYETVLKVISNLDKSQIYGMDIGAAKWYEIDDAQDLDIAEIMFSAGCAKYDGLISKFGGYWRYPRINDFCYLVNPFFPPKSFVDKITHEFPKLLLSYPSGMDIQKLNAERIFGINKNYVLVGNGAAELINCFARSIKGKIAVGLPTFNEYVRCFSNAEILDIDNSKFDYCHNLSAYKSFCDKVKLICIVNPDNPSGSTMQKAEIFELLDYAKERNCKILIDESFMDFADDKNRFTLLTNEILEKYPNLIVVKSIGKSYGVAGLRLGIIATSNNEIIKIIRDNLAIWNINSIAEYYLQTYNLYSSDYKEACKKIIYEREFLISGLKQIKGIKVYPSQANYIMVDLMQNNSYDFCVKALNDYNLLIKDLSTKNYFKGKNFVRIAVKNHTDNQCLLDCFKKILEE